MGLFRRRRVQPADPLDTPLFQWGPGSFLTARQLLANILILGATGSGKTSATLRHLLGAILNYPRSGGLILATKASDKNEVTAMFKAKGRLKDLLVMSPEGSLRCNAMDYARQMGAGPTELTNYITTLGETLQRGDRSGGGENDRFFSPQETRMIFFTVVVLLLAKGKITLPDVQEFITTSLQTPEQAASPSWTGCFHDQRMREAFAAPKSSIQEHDYQLALQYFLRELPYMASRTRSSIQTAVLGTLHTLNTGVNRELFSTTTNVTPDVTLEGRWLFVDMAPAVYGETGVVASAAVKYLTEQRVLKRNPKPGDGIHVTVCDEFQTVANHMDANYVGMCRSHYGCMIVLTQSLHSIFAAMKGETGKNQANALLTNFNHKIFNALGDPETAAYASSLVGRELQMRFGASMQPDEDVFSAMFGPPKVTSSFNEQFEAVLQPNEFYRLRTGGPNNGYLVDAIVVKSGESFPDGRNFKWVTFSQKG